MGLTPWGVSSDYGVTATPIAVGGGMVGRRGTRFHSKVVGYPLPLLALSWLRGDWLVEEPIKGQYVPQLAVLLGTNVREPYCTVEPSLWSN